MHTQKKNYKNALVNFPNFSINISENSDTVIFLLKLYNTHKVIAGYWLLHFHCQIGKGYNSSRLDRKLLL